MDSGAYKEINESEIKEIFLSSKCIHTKDNRGHSSKTMAKGSIK